MKTVRIGTFETNSSSMHNMCMCTEEDYQKFLGMEKFLNYETLHTLDELYDAFIKIYGKQDPNSYEREFVEKGLLGKLPSLETFKKALFYEDNFNYVDYDSDREEYNTDEDWIIANIQSYFYEQEIGNCHNFNMRGGMWYERFKDSFNGVVAFGYYGHD